MAELSVYNNEDKAMRQQHSMVSENVPRLKHFISASFSGYQRRPRRWNRRIHAAFLLLMQGAMMIGIGAKASSGFFSGQVKQPSPLIGTLATPGKGDMQPWDIDASCSPGYYEPLSLHKLARVGASYRFSPLVIARGGIDWQPKIRDLSDFFSTADEESSTFPKEYQTFLGGNLNGSVRGLLKNTRLGIGGNIEGLYHADVGGMFGGNLSLEGGMKVFKLALFGGMGFNQPHSQLTKNYTQKLSLAKKMGCSLIVVASKWCFIDGVFGKHFGKQIRPQSISNTFQTVESPYFAHISMMIPCTSWLNVGLGAGSDALGCTLPSELSTKNVLSGGIVLNFHWRKEQKIMGFSDKSLDAWQHNLDLALPAQWTTAYEPPEIASEPETAIVRAIPAPVIAQNRSCAVSQNTLSAPKGLQDKKSSVCLEQGPASVIEPSIAATKISSKQSLPVSAHSPLNSVKTLPVMPEEKDSKTSLVSPKISSIHDICRQKWSHSTAIIDQPLGSDSQKSYVNSWAVKLSAVDPQMKTNDTPKKLSGFDTTGLPEKLYHAHTELCNALLQSCKEEEGYIKLACLLFNIEAMSKADWPGEGAEAAPWRLSMRPEGLSEEHYCFYQENIKKSYRLMRSDSDPEKSDEKGEKGLLGVVISLKRSDANNQSLIEKIARMPKFLEEIFGPYCWHYFYNDILASSASLPAEPQINHGKNEWVHRKSDYWTSVMLEKSNSTPSSNKNTKVRITFPGGKHDEHCIFPWFLDNFSVPFELNDQSNVAGGDGLQTQAHMISSIFKEGRSIREVCVRCYRERKNNILSMTYQSIPVELYLIPATKTIFEEISYEKIQECFNDVKHSLSSLKNSGNMPLNWRFLREKEAKRVLSTFKAIYPDSSESIKADSKKKPTLYYSESSRQDKDIEVWGLNWDGTRNKSPKEGLLWCVIAEKNQK